MRPTWDSLRAHYRVPDWYAAAKFGLMLHWGLFDVLAHGSEWYETHMYGPFAAWHGAHFGPLEAFGYKDFSPKFTAARFDADGWAELFQRSGARYVIPTAQHHDGFALWASDGAAPWNAGTMGPKRDLIGDPAKAVRARGLTFGVSNHGIENFQFINPKPDVAARLKAAHADLYDPEYQGFYHVADRTDAACQAFLTNWAARNVELIDRYRPDILWFDNGVDQRYLDSLKLWVAAYYYDRAAGWGKQVTLNTKKAAYAPGGMNTATVGSVIGFERIGKRSPTGIRTGTWDVDEPIGSTWGYTDGETFAKAGAVVAELVDTVSKNGTLLLNLSPEADGTINAAQRATLLGVGRWLGTNGEAIYGTHNWTTAGEGGRGTPVVRFTVKGQDLYAIVIGPWPAVRVTVASLGTAAGPVGGVTLLGHGGPLPFSQDAAGLTVELPAVPPCEFACTLKVSGLTVNPTTVTADGNPVP